jgi:hypothetical protein
LKEGLRKEEEEEEEEEEEPFPEEEKVLLWLLPAPTRLVISPRARRGRGLCCV